MKKQEGIVIPPRWDLEPVCDKHELSDGLAEATREFLATGGEVQKVKMGVTGYERLSKDWQLSSKKGTKNSHGRKK